MGLDSYINLVSKKHIDVPEHCYVKDFEQYEREDGTFCIELGYFRKCWYIHDIMMGLPNSENNGTFEGGVDTLECFILGLLSAFKEPDEFEARSQIFTWEEELMPLARTLTNCYWALKVLNDQDQAGEVWMEYVDSY